jgi:hypothetical protein
MDCCQEYRAAMLSLAQLVLVPIARYKTAHAEQESAEQESNG